MKHSFSVATILACCGISDATSQALSRRVASAPQGSVQFSFAARAGVCGDGQSIRIGSSSFGNFYVRDHRRKACVVGPVRVALTRRQGEITSLRTYVGDAAGEPETDIGIVSTREAVDYLIGLAPRLRGRSGDQAVLAAVIADSVVIWPALLELVRHTTIPRGTREAATFWLGRAAAVAATGLSDTMLDDEHEDDATSVRTHAIFALSQLPHDEGVPELVQIVRTHRDPHIRKRAIFWLGQSGDPRAIALFEELLKAKQLAP